MLRHAYTRRFLFHYTRKERAIEDIFPGMRIRMGSMKRTNDPRETDPWFFGKVLDEEEQQPGEFEGQIAVLNKVLKDACRIACFTEDRPDAHPEWGDPDRFDRPDLEPQGCAHDRMWAQYAGDHTGVCIFFDREKLIRRMEDHFAGRPGRLIHGPVVYTQRIDPRDSPFYGLSQAEINRLGIGGLLASCT